MQRIYSIFTHVVEAVILAAGACVMIYAVSALL